MDLDCESAVLPLDPKAMVFKGHDVGPFHPSPPLQEATPVAARGQRKHHPRLPRVQLRRWLNSSPWAKRDPREWKEYEG